jgi:hypothetical protein
VEPGGSVDEVPVAAPGASGQGREGKSLEWGTYRVYWHPSGLASPSRKNEYFPLSFRNAGNLRSKKTRCQSGRRVSSCMTTQVTFRAASVPRACWVARRAAISRMMSSGRMGWVVVVR